MSKLHQLAEIGQALWLDDLNRSLLNSGKLMRLIDEDAISGVTSNPTIFAKAITTSDDYDEQLLQLVRDGADLDHVYTSLVSEDIREACDALRETWDKTNRTHGWASVEVSPQIAYDTETTVAEVHEWVKRVDRDNLFVKVPATPQGVDAIERLIGEGISINVTLIFSLARYNAIAEAYISGLERFVASGGDPSTVQSVASFFVSRVDTEIDRRLDELGKPELQGNAGVANARAAYGMFQELFSGDRWEPLAAAGARVQRPLWASTGVKNPAYRDTMYIEDLIAPDTVNTMPEPTIRAFQDHGDPGVGPFTEGDIQEARSFLDELAAAGIDYDDVTDVVLEREGVEKFVTSFDELMVCLGSKRDAISKDAQG